MNPPDWATHEIVFDRGQGECRVWVGPKAYEYSMSNGEFTLDRHYLPSWGISGWLSAIKDSKYKLISAYPINISLENK